MPINGIERLRGYYNAIRNMPDQTCADLENDSPERLYVRMLWIYAISIIVMRRRPVITDDDGTAIDPIDFYKQELRKGKV